MARREYHPPHIYLENACYFITAGTAHHRRLFNSDGQRFLMRDVLREAVKACGIELHAWVILADHHHLLLTTSDTVPLHQFMRRLHSTSAVRLNKLDGIPGRRVWYQYWDRFPRSEAEFWAYFCYIHINPIKHGYVQMAEGALGLEGKQVSIRPGGVLDIHSSLVRYPQSSYHYYVREFGEEFLSGALVQYPIPVHIENDDFEGGN